MFTLEIKLLLIDNKIHIRKKTFQ